MSSTQKYTSVCSALEAEYFYTLWHESGRYYPRGQALCRTLLPPCGQEYATCPRLLLLLPILEGPIDCIRRNPADHKKTPLMIFQLSVGNSFRVFLRMITLRTNLIGSIWNHMIVYPMTLALLAQCIVGKVTNIGTSTAIAREFNKLIRKGVYKCFFL